MSTGFLILFWSLLVLFVLVCVALILIILIQKGRGGGFASAFGGGGSGHTAFGAKTGDVLTWATSIIFGVFLVLAVVLNLMADARHKVYLEEQSGKRQQQSQAQ